MRDSVRDPQDIWYFRPSNPENLESGSYKTIKSIFLDINISGFENYIPGIYMYIFHTVHSKSKPSYFEIFNCIFIFITCLQVWLIFNLEMEIHIFLFLFFKSDFLCNSMFIFIFLVCKYLEHSTGHYFLFGNKHACGENKISHFQEKTVNAVTNGRKKNY